MPRPRRLVSCALLSIAALATVRAQIPQTPGTPAERGDAAVSGVVRDASTNQPIAGAVVQLRPFGIRETPDNSFRQFSDGQGRFVFTELPAGSDLRLTANKSGYFDGVYGAVGPWYPWQSPSIQLKPGQWLNGADLKMWRPGSLSGVVTDERGEPCVGVFVRAFARTRVAGTDQLAAVTVVLTDDRGMYRVPNLYPGTYIVMVPSVQASTPSSTALATLLGLSQQALDASRAAGRTIPAIDPLVTVDAGTRLVVRGYPVPPPPTDGSAMTYPLAFAGGATPAQATAFNVTSGADVTGADVRLAPVPAVRISGTVDGPPEIRANLTLRLLAEGLEGNGLGTEAGTTLVADDGSFAFANVPAGRYVIDVPVSINQYTAGMGGLFYTPEIPRPPGMSGLGSNSGPAPALASGIGITTSDMVGRPYWARVPTAAGAQGAANVVVALQPTLTMRGKVVVDGSQPEGTSLPRFVHLETATGSTLHGSPRSVTRNVPAGEFAIERIVPGKYWLRGDSGGFTVKSVMVGGREHVAAPIEIEAGSDLSGVVVTFTNAAPLLTGAVRDASGALTKDAAVVVFPVEQEQWTEYGLSPSRIKMTPASSAGAYAVRGLPAGEYFVVAIEAAKADAWQEPSFFSRMQSVAQRVTLNWGDKKIADVRVSPVR